MKQPTALDPRLAGAAGYVRRGAYFADIGTDHAYLPVFLSQSGVIARAIASDIAEGPLANAARTVREAGLSDRISLRLTDGLTGLENEGVTDIAICGMGGEVIADILSRAPFVRNGSVRLILQPMTRAAHLREYLAREGFRVVSETVTLSRGKVYACLCAEWTGIPYSLSPAEAELGAYTVAHRDGIPLFDTLLRERIAVARKQLDGRVAGGLDTRQIQALLTELEDLT